ncbi:MAG TPA: hypothetical protein VD886_01760 [Herpetosiphonaceae bacterium]|nr:hypothetical protein [Herpetosiphonaceae bacterium]
MRSLSTRTLLILLLITLAGCSGAATPTPPTPTRGSPAPPAAALPTRPAAPAEQPAAPPAAPAEQPAESPPAASEDRSTPELALASYFNAITRQDYARAYAYWEQPPGNADLATFAAGFADTAAVRPFVGLPVAVDVGAGNAYAAMPTLLVVRHTDGSIETLQGCYVAHRTNIDPGQRDWSLRQAEITPGPLDPAGLVRPAAQCGEVNAAGLDFADTAAPIATLASYYAAIGRQDYARAYGYWRSAPDGADEAAFAAGFADTADVRVYVDPAFVNDAAAGGQFSQTAALVVARHGDGSLETLSGCYALSRPNAGNFDPPAEQPWLLHSASIAAVALAQLPAALSAQECRP